jgi:hypothetical protein
MIAYFHGFGANGWGESNNDRPAMMMLRNSEKKIS